MTHTGQCLCGAVKLSIDADPLGARTCWCHDCQKFGSGNGTTNAFFADDAVHCDGEVSWYEGIADSGNRTRRGFCPKCGAPIFIKGSGRPDICGIRVGMSDDAKLGAPKAVIWTKSAPEWAVFDPNLPQFTMGPPPPSAKA